MKSRRNVIEIDRLRPTQITVGMLQVKHKRARLRQLERRPAELVEFILVHPIRVVIGPKKHAYVIDRHHLALALLREKIETAPMDVEADFSNLNLKAFWKKMNAEGFVYLYDAEGRRKKLSDIPKCLDDLENDVYRSLAGFVREAGGFRKVPTPYSEFIWAKFYRERIKEKVVKKNFDKALKRALALARRPEAKNLPGYLPDKKK